MHVSPCTALPSSCLEVCWLSGVFWKKAEDEVTGLVGATGLCRVQIWLIRRIWCTRQWIHVSYTSVYDQTMMI